MAKRSKYTVEVDKKIQKKFWRALTPTDRDMSRGYEQECPVYGDYDCAHCPFGIYTKGSQAEWPYKVIYGCDVWRKHFAPDKEWYEGNMLGGDIPKSARPLFHKFYREFRKKIKPFIVWV